LKTKGTKKRRLRPALILAPLAALAAAIGFLVPINNLYIDYSWFGETGYLAMYLKQIWVGAAFSIPLFLALAVAFAVAFRAIARKAAAPEGSARPFYLKWWVRYLLGGAFAALLMGMGIFRPLWREWLAFSSAVPFGQADPIFGKDISFYIYRLPLYEKLLSQAYALCFVALLFCLAYYGIKYAKEALPSDRTAKGYMSEVWKHFKAPLSAFAVLFFALRSVSVLLARYGIVSEPSSLIYGAGYTSAHVLSPFYVTEAVFCLICAASCIAAAAFGKPRPFVVALALYAAVLIGGAAAVRLYEAYVVAPNQLSREEPYIASHIAFTQKAYGLDSIESRPFEVGYTLDADAIERNRTTVDNIPINDYLPTIDIYNSLQGIRPYYRFADIDVDRYMLGGKYTQVFIAGREMDTARLTANSWINTYLKYTHGFGFVASPVNEVSKSGQPVLLSKDIPPTRDYEELMVAEPRIYFGELDSPYAVVNTKTMEFDYPQGNANAENAYSGNAGIPLTFLNRLSFALRYGTTKFLFSSDISPDSKILINRGVVSRAKKIAPFLEYDGDPYLILAEGRLYYVLDAMTVASGYPYSQPFDEDGNNYIRNSVKCVVDAYNGDTRFYLVDGNDPISLTYDAMYPGLFRAMEEMPPSIRAHLRYSESYFDVQAKMYASYHMSNPVVFYNREDVWEVANQFYNTSKEQAEVNPSYVVMKLPGRQNEEFLLIQPFTPQNKDNMVSWMAGVCDGEDYGKLIVYEFPKQSLLYGPMQIEQRIDQEPSIAPQLNLLSQQGASILRGNMQTIPIENSVLYVEAIYVRSSGGETSLPEVKKVILSYGEQIVMADNLESAIATLFGKAEGAPAGEGPSKPPQQASPEGASRALALYREAQEALQAGNWALYGEKMQALEDALNELAQPAETQ
jgi:uncharacterized membrane protein (UPF0182 family)